MHINSFTVILRSKWKSFCRIAHCQSQNVNFQQLKSVLQMFSHYQSTLLFPFVYLFFLSSLAEFDVPSGLLMNWCSKSRKSVEIIKCSTHHWKSSAIAAGFDYKESWRQRDDILKICISQAVFKIHCASNQLSKITLDPIFAHYPLMHEMRSFALNANLKALVQHSSHKVTGFLILV